MLFGTVPQQNATRILYTLVCVVFDVSEINDHLVRSAAIRHRILQSAGRRYSVKLEAAFWRVLEETAALQGMRLNQLVGQLAESLSLERGLTSALRLFCLDEAINRLRAAEDEIADLSLAAGTTDIAAIIEACPAPCLVISQDRIIQRANEAFIHWLQARHEDLLDQPMDRFFQIRGHFRLDELWARFGSGYSKPVPAKLAYVAPGRVTVAKAYLCPTAVKGPDDFSCLIMLDQSRAR